MPPARNLTAVLGPTNTGKTHLAVERMLAHGAGMIGLPLRLLAREIYDRVRLRAGDAAVALVTGEEKIVPANPRYWVSTVEAMPAEVEVPFLAIDEVQLCADFERGHIFTDRVLHRRGREETMLLGAATMRPILENLLPGTTFVARPRFSKLTYAGQKKITRLPGRSAIVAFSAEMVYAVAELIRRQRGGAAVVLGALSPRTRNAQVALYQSGDVDYIVATDAIGMGLNMDVDHVAFASTRKFDGFQFRQLGAGELGQVAGRAGRYLNDGTFGVTGEADPFDAETVDRLENHRFEAVRVLKWRNRDLDFGSLDRLRRSLSTLPRVEGLTRAQAGPDALALEAAARDSETVALTTAAADVARLWEVCQIPDYRNISHSEHANLVARIFQFLRTGRGYIDEDWFARQLKHCDRAEGDLDTLSNRISHIRTWTFVANRADWLEAPLYWQSAARAIEDKLSDALHERLTQRFIDRRTSILMKRLAQKEELMSTVEEDGAVRVEGILKPRASVSAGDQLTGSDRDEVQARLQKFLDRHIATTLEPLIKLEEGEGLEGMARGIAFRLVETMGVLPREQVADEVKSLSQEDRAKLRALGARFGAFHLFVPALLKPAASELRLLLWALGLAKEGKLELSNLPLPPSQGLTSAVFDRSTPRGFYGVCGYRICGNRVVRVDMLERLADLIRDRVFWRPRFPDEQRPAGSVEGGGFAVVPDMMSLVGCSGEEFQGILRSLDFRMQTKKVKRPVTAAPAVAAEPAAPAAEAAPELDQGATATPEHTPEPAGDSVAAAEPGPPAAESTDAAAVPETAEVTAPVLEELGIEVWWPKDTGPFRHRPERQKPHRQRSHTTPRPETPAEAGSGTTEVPAAATSPLPEGEPRKERPRRDDRGPRRETRKARIEERKFPPREERQPRPEKPIDPDSPFAVLAALKAKMAGNQS
ncbi:MAG: helicase [Rhizobiales bacterium]|nr:helicase [Hyphomicrobiales bacterium]